MPDFLVLVNDGHGPANPLKLILEVSGQRNDDIGEKKKAKAATARDLWVPAVNGTGLHGRWAYLEVSDPWDVVNTLRKRLPELSAATRSHSQQPAAASSLHH